MDLGKCNDALDADAVLARGLEGTAHKDAGYALEVAVGQVVKENGWIFAAEFDAYWR